MCCKFRGLMGLVLPVVALGLGGLAVAGGAIPSQTGLAAPSVAVTPSHAPQVAPAPESLSPAVTARDWQEVAGSVRRRI